MCAKVSRVHSHQQPVTTSKMFLHFHPFLKKTIHFSFPSLSIHFRDVSTFLRGCCAACNLLQPRKQFFGGWQLLGTGP